MNDCLKNNKRAKQYNESQLDLTEKFSFFKLEIVSLRQEHIRFLFLYNITIIGLEEWIRINDSDVGHLIKKHQLNSRA